MSYRQNVDANRDALFGGGPPAASGVGARNTRPKPSSNSYKQSASADRNSLFGNAAGNRANPTRVPAGGNRAPSTAPAAEQQPPQPQTESPATTFKARTRTTVTTVLTGQAKIDKMKEAEEFREKAKKAMTKTLFSRPDPISAGTYYRRAAEAYKQCGENRLERLHRIASGDMQMRQDSYAVAAAEYTRAAELSAVSDESTLRKQKEVYQLYKNAADAWAAMGESGKVAECYTKAAFGLAIDKPDADLFDKKTHEALEEAVEIHIPDILNRQACHRMTGKKGDVDGMRGSAGRNAAALSSQEQKERAKEEMSKSAYSHETVQQIMAAFCQTGEYQSALYAAGAITAILEESGFSTISLSRAYVTETILQLALGDIVAADKTFMEVHLQNTQYLSSRECQLAEDLIRAIKDYDQEALQAAKTNRALASVDPAIRQVASTLQVSGKAPRKKIVADRVAKATNNATMSAAVGMSNIGTALTSMTTAAKAAVGATSPQRKPMNSDDLQDEMHDLMNEMGLGSKDSSNADDDSDDDDEDDDIDLK